MEDLRGLYRSPNIVRIVKYRWPRWARMGEMRSDTEFWWGNLLSLGRPRGECEDNIYMDLRGIGCEGGKCMGLSVVAGFSISGAGT
jgi:hypothetical protein